MAARTTKREPQPRYGDGASLYLYAGSNQDIISLNADWTPKPTPPATGDLWTAIRGAFITNLNDLTEKEQHRG
jgi:hypothetical protein